MMDANEREKRRLRLLVDLDAARPQAERNRLGQFATPPALASEVVSTAASYLSDGDAIRFLEPGFGTGSFYSALLRSGHGRRIGRAVGFEADPRYGGPASELWSGTGLELHHADFTEVGPPSSDSEKFNLVVCNPPYVRHHHLDPAVKQRLQAIVFDRIRSDMNGLSGLYCYFLALSLPWMASGGVAAWLIPSEFMDVNYGLHVKRLLLDRVTLLRIHRFDPKEVQFGDALVSSAVVFFRNTPPTEGHEVAFTYGGTMSNPGLSATIAREKLRSVSKWTSLPFQVKEDANESRGTLADLFSIRRGLATGCNQFFILTPDQVREHEIPIPFIKPILPSPRELNADEVMADEAGNPQIDRKRFLLDCSLPESEVEVRFPLLWKYLLSGVEQGIDQRYLCRHRNPWYSQESRPPSLFLCTYMGRPSKKNADPFRFLLNHSKATAANVYLLLYPKPRMASALRSDPALPRRVWQGLRSIKPEAIQGEGRIYGGGLHKIEPKELANVPADIVLGSLSNMEPIAKSQGLLFGST